MSRGWLLLFGLIGASLIPLVLGGSDMFSRLRAFPLDSLLLMFGMIGVCWFINGLRLRLLLAGRAGKLGQLQSVGIIMASEFAFCATPGGTARSCISALPCTTACACRNDACWRSSFSAVRTGYCASACSI